MIFPVNTLTHHEATFVVIIIPIFDCKLPWPDIAGSLPVSRYVIDNGDERNEVTQPNCNLAVDFKGARIIPVVALDSAGNTSEAGIFEVVPSPPLAAVVRTSVIVGVSVSSGCLYR